MQPVQPRQRGAAAVLISGWLIVGIDGPPSSDCPRLECHVNVALHHRAKHLEHDPVKLQTFRTRSCANHQRIRRRAQSATDAQKRSSGRQFKVNASRSRASAACNDFPRPVLDTMCQAKRCRRRVNEADARDAEACLVPDGPGTRKRRRMIGMIHRITPSPHPVGPSVLRPSPLQPALRRAQWAKLKTLAREGEGVGAL